MITAFFAKWGAKLLGAAVALAAILGSLGMYGRAKKHEGASEEREKAATAAADAAEKRHEIDSDVARASDDHLDKRLSRWKRRNN